MELFLSLTCHPCYDHSFKSYLKEKFWEGFWEREQGKRFRKIAKGGEGEHEKEKDPKIVYVAQKSKQFYWSDGFWLLVELHWEGSAPAACTACLFLNKQKTL